MSSGLSQWFNWNRVQESDELPDIFPMDITQAVFVKTDVVAIYAKILTDVLERTHGLTDDQVALMWDNCVMSSSNDGLVTRLAKAMSDRQDLFLVYEKAVNVIRVATVDEQTQIKADYEKTGESAVGLYISFKNFNRSDMVKFYIALEYCTVGALHKSMNLSKALQLKMNDMRGSVALADADEAKAQAKRIAEALSRGKDVILDGKDEIVTSVPDLTAVKESISFLLQKLSFYLGLPSSYISGEQTAGIGSTGENDMRAVERGLKAYYFAVIKPVLESLFGVKLSYKSQDFRQIENAANILKVFALIDDTLVSAENKTKIVNRILDLPEDAVGDPARPPRATPPGIAFGAGSIA